MAENETKDPEQELAEFREGMDLMAQIVEANGRALATSTERVMDHLRRDRAQMAQDYLWLLHAVTEATEVITTRELERVLFEADCRAETARRYLAERTE